MTDETHVDDQTPDQATQDDNASDHKADATQSDSEDGGKETEASAAPEGGDDTADAKKDEKSKKRRNPAQKRIDRLTREKYALEARISELERRMGEGKPEPDTQPDKPADLGMAAPVAPNVDDFETYQDYLDAYAKYSERLIDYKVEQRTAKAQQSDKPDEPQAPAPAEPAPEYVEFRDAGVAEYGNEFIEVMQDVTLPITDTMANAMFADNNGAHVLMYLGDNPDKAAEIAAMPPHKQIRAINQLGSEVSGNEPGQPQKKTTDAPAPIDPVKGSDTPVADMDKLPIEKWMERRNQQVRG